MHVERFAFISYSFLFVENRTFTCGVDYDGCYEIDRRENNHGKQWEDDVEGSFDYLLHGKEFAVCYSDKGCVEYGIHFHIAEKDIFPVCRDFYFNVLTGWADDVVDFIFFIGFQCNDDFFYFVFLGYGGYVFCIAEIW